MEAKKSPSKLPFEELAEVSAIDEDERENVNSSSEDEDDENEDEVEENQGNQHEEMKQPTSPKSATLNADPRNS